MTIPDQKQGEEKNKTQQTKRYNKPTETRQTAHKT